MHFLRVNVTFYDAANMIDDVITTPDPFSYTRTAKFMFVGVRNNKLNKSDVERYLEYVHSAVVSRLGEMIIFSQGSKIIYSPNLVR